MFVIVNKPGRLLSQSYAFRPRAYALKWRNNSLAENLVKLNLSFFWTLKMSKVLSIWSTLINWVLGCLLAFMYECMSFSMTYNGKLVRGIFHTEMLGFFHMEIKMWVEQ